MSTDKKYCCKAFEYTVMMRIIRFLHGRYISDSIAYTEEDPSMISDVYRIHSIQMMVHDYCQFCGAKL